MISVRNTGRVKLHKARENANGTFSIGKSWPMEELSSVENYVHLTPLSEEEAQRKAMGWRERVHRDYQQTVLLGSWDCEREGVLYR
jgi:hypothetical protein